MNTATHHRAGTALTVVLIALVLPLAGCRAAQTTGTAHHNASSIHHVQASAGDPWPTTPDVGYWVGKGFHPGQIWAN